MALINNGLPNSLVIVNKCPIATSQIILNPALTLSIMKSRLFGDKHECCMFTYCFTVRVTDLAVYLVLLEAFLFGIQHDSQITGNNNTLLFMQVYS